MEKTADRGGIKIKTSKALKAVLPTSKNEWSESFSLGWEWFCKGHVLLCIIV
jgi:hypothetical protein